MNSTLTDISSDIESAFDEMECCADVDRWGEHGGSKAAYYDAHGCYAGFLCQTHYQVYIHQLRPYNSMVLMMHGRIQCDICKVVRHTLDEVDKVYPL